VARDYSFWIYIVTNRNHSVLYIGVTNSLSRRGWQHREGTGAIFPSAYRCTKLIYYEHYRDIRAAIARETQLKKWSRAKKVALINRLNPRWMAPRCSENSERCLHFGRHDRATEHGNISHLAANEVEAFAGESGGPIGRPEEAQLLEVSGQALNRHGGSVNRRYPPSVRFAAQ
jgi:putative endonuclease